MKKKLRSGYTTGACAAAAAKTAAVHLLTGRRPRTVSVPFPDGSHVDFAPVWSRLGKASATAAVRKDAGDDPDVTNGALIVARVRRVAPGVLDETGQAISITGGEGVGVVTKPGLSVGVGRPAINAVPLSMIRAAVNEARQAHNDSGAESFEVRISVPEGEALARKTLNRRLGIIGGISILGTTGIVKPISAAAWTATITASMAVARAAGLREIILSTGRTSERCVEAVLGLPEEALVMMGDYLEFALKEAGNYSFTRLHLAVMWAKMLKGAMKMPQTHVRHGMLTVEQIERFFLDQGVRAELIAGLAGANTAREVLERLLAGGQDGLIRLVCDRARHEYEAIAAIPVTVHLVHGSGRLICSRQAADD